MRIPTSRGSRADFGSTAMTPLIDIVFQLLIFFICASTGHMREFLLPVDFGAGSMVAADERPPQPLGEVWIKLQRQDGATTVTIEGTTYPDWERVRQVLLGLAEITAEIPVILEIAPEVPMGDVIRIDDLCRAAKFQSVSFAAKAPAAIP